MTCSPVSTQAVPRQQPCLFIAHDVPAGIQLSPSPRAMQNGSSAHTGTGAPGTRAQQLLSHWLLVSQVEAQMPSVGSAWPGTQTVPAQHASVAAAGAVAAAHRSPGATQASLSATGIGWGSSALLLSV